MRGEEVRATLILMAGLAAATLTGFLREASLAHQLGAGRATDIYLIAFALPEFVFALLPIVVWPAVIPLFTDLRLRLGDRSAWRWGLRVTGATLTLLVLASALAAAGAGRIVRWLAPGFEAEEQRQAVKALLWMLPALSLMGAASLAGALLQVYRRFARPALATAAYNLAFVATLLGAPVAWPVGRAVLGVACGAAAALVLQVPFLWRHRPHAQAAANPAPSQAEEPRPIGVRHAAGLAAPLAAGYALHHAIYFVDRAMATTLGAGSVATLNYGYRLALVVGQLCGLAVSTAVFPRMAEQAAQGDLDGLRRSLAGAMRFVWMLGVPAAGGMIVLRQPLVQVVFERGAFGSAATSAVSQVLVWYALAVLADALCQPLWRAVYARRRGWTVLAVNGMQTVVRIAGNLALIDRFGYNGLALSAALGLALQALVLGCLAQRDLGRVLDTAWLRGAGWVIVAAAPALIAAGWLARASSSLPAVGVLALSSVLGGAVYFGAVRLLLRGRL